MNASRQHTKIVWGLGVCLAKTLSLKSVKSLASVLISSLADRVDECVQVASVRLRRPEVCVGADERSVHALAGDLCGNHPGGNPGANVWFL